MTTADEPQQRSMSRRVLLGGIGGLVVGAAGVATALELSQRGGPAQPPAAPFAAHFGQSGLVTNEYAYRSPHAADARTDPDWSVTSGSLFAKDGDGWTGLPDSGETGTDSQRYTDSAVFRLVTHRRDFGDAEVRCSVLVGRPVTTARTPLQDYDGGHVWLRYHSPEELYALSFRRRDGLVVIKRKVPADDPSAANGGDYATLVQAEHAFAYDTWHDIRASAENRGSGVVRLRLEIDGRTVLSTDDRTPGPLRAPGGVGLRGDNSELTFKAFTATAL
ncbi:hypothetical protein [Streptacidiphilus sp. PAMC 29251]